MVIPHAISGEPVDVRPLGAQPAAAKSIALFKSEDLEVMRVVLLAGKAMPAHRLAGEITIQCIEGSLDVTVDGASHVLHAGHLLYLSGRAVHAVTAVEDSSALITVALKK